MVDQQGVADKLLHGDRLTLAEWKTATKYNFIEGDFSDHSDEEVVQREYHNFISTYYIGRTLQGYICNLHLRKKYLGKDGKEYLCTHGVHAEDLDPARLTFGNFGYLLVSFGTEVTLVMPNSIGGK